MPRKKVACPVCGQPMAAESKACRACSQPYNRTAEHRQAMSNTLNGKPKPWLQGRSRPGHAQTMREWWTEERREAKRAEMLKANPQARYHGLSARDAAAFVKRIGHCERCGHDGSSSRLGVHHRNRDKHDQRLRNLEVLCHQCHMQEHGAAGEIGRGRKTKWRSTTPD